MSQIFADEDNRIESARSFSITNLRSSAYICGQIPTAPSRLCVRSAELFSVLSPNRIEMRVIRLRPAGKRNFLAGVELDAFAALYVQVAEEGSIPAGKWEPCHRR